MPWVIGIDEAGYGPNLGPLVQAAAAIWMPPDDLAGWKSYSHCVRRCGELDDGRLLIDDSKRVHSGPDKLAKLERTVMPMKNCSIVLPDRPRQMALKRFLSQWECKPHEEVNDPGLVHEFWYDPEFNLPVEWKMLDCETVLGHVGNFGWVHCMLAVYHRITNTTRINHCIQKTGTKATAVTSGIVGLMKDSVDVGYIADHDSRYSPIHYYCDKLGGRHYYAPLLQEAFPDGWIVAERESPAESRYRIEKLDREVTVIFRPRADADSVSVALASMTAKYLREVCMKQFNAFWAKHVPGIKPTAGYPVDAKRFYHEIEPAMKKLGIAKEAVWRMK